MYSGFQVGGVLIGYHRICKRKAWYKMHGLEMEQESEAVALGRLLDETAYNRQQKHLTVRAVAPDGTSLVGKIDWANLQEGILHETKKGRAMEDAHRWQVRFYLWLLKQAGHGSALTGSINYPALKQTETVTLEPEHEQTLQDIVTGLKELHEQSGPPERLDSRRLCKKCAFEELCYG
jgi:CRISPR-associated exonuclease Cas4